MITEDFARLRVLVVDDEEGARILMEAHLARIGIEEILTADSGETAMTVLRDATKIVKVVITDYRMPIMNGTNLISAIRRDPDLQQLRIAMVSSDLTDRPEKCLEESDLRSFLAQMDVLAVPKVGLNREKLIQAFKTLIGI